MSEYREQLEKRIREAPPITEEEAIEALREIKRRLAELDGIDIRLDRKVVTVVFEEAEEMDGWWIASSPDLPGVLTQGRGLAETVGNFRDAYELMEEDEGSG